jgi:hypothetical protein
MPKAGQKNHRMEETEAGKNNNNTSTTGKESEQLIALILP